MAAGTQSSRRNPTQLVELFIAGSIAVCRMGDKVALHIYTTEGEKLVHMRERDFVRSCRGPADHNGNPFRTLEQLDEEKRRKEEADSLPPPEPGAKSTPSRKRSSLTPETLAKFEEVAAIAEGPHNRGDITAACKARGINRSSFNTWRRNQKRGGA